ncbi:unnamed protein product [Rhizopus stolonifer]
MKALQQKHTSSQQMIEHLCYRWKVQIRNGNFSIDTGIKCLSEILQYQQSTSYLPPISTYSSSSSEDSWGENNDIFVSFKTEEYGSLYGITGKILSKCRQKTMIGPSSLMSNCTAIGLQVIMNQLVDIYFSCHNTYFGVVHESSFRNNIELAEVPFDDLISFAICSFVCSTPCDHLVYNARQRRTMGDFFYSKAKEIMLDQFDDPSKKTENVTAILLLYNHMHMTLQFREYDLYLTMAYQICLEMKAHYSKIGPQPTVEYALFTRHISYGYSLRVMLDCVTNKSATRQPLPFPKLVPMSDESETMRKFLQVHDHILSIYRHPFIDMLFEQMHLIYLGLTCTVKLELILKLDEILLEYRQTIPGQKGFCEDIYNEEKCKKEIDESEDFFTIFVFVHFSSIVLSFYASCLQPVTLTNENEELLNIISQNSLERSQKAARLSFYGIKRIYRLKFTSCCFQLASTECIFYNIDTLILQLSAKDMASEARQMFFDAIKTIQNNHAIQKKDLPPIAQIVKCDIKEFIRSHKTDTNCYDKYPDPWCALMYNLSQCL